MMDILSSKARLFDDYAKHSHLAASSPEAVDISEAALAKTVVEQEQERLALQLLSRLPSAGNHGDGVDEFDERVREGSDQSS